MKSLSTLALKEVWGSSPSKRLVSVSRPTQKSAATAFVGLFGDYEGRLCLRYSGEFLNSSIPHLFPRTSILLWGSPSQSKGPGNEVVILGGISHSRSSEIGGGWGMRCYITRQFIPPFFRGMRAMEKDLRLRVQSKLTYKCIRNIFSAEVSNNVFLLIGRDFSYSVCRLLSSL